MVILLARIIHMPTHDFAHSDMTLIRPKLQLLKSLAGKSSTEELQWMSEACNELARRAQSALDSQLPNEELDLGTAMLDNYETVWQPSFPGFPFEVHGNPHLQSHYGYPVTEPAPF